MPQSIKHSIKVASIKWQYQKQYGNTSYNTLRHSNIDVYTILLCKVPRNYDEEHLQYTFSCGSQKKVETIQEVLI